MVSAFNLSLIFVVLCALAGSSFASPLPTPTAVVHASSPSRAINLEQSLAQIQMEFQNSLKSLYRNSEWIFPRLKQIVHNTLESGFNNVANWIWDILLRVETFMIADGSHYIFPLNSHLNLEVQYKTIGISVSKLLRNLKTMKRADALIAETVKKVIDVSDSESDEESYSDTNTYFRTFLHLYFRTLDCVFKDDLQLGVEYKKLYTEATKFVKQNPAEMHKPIFPIGDTSLEMSIPDIKTFLKDKLIYLEVVASKQFMKQSEKNLFMVFNPIKHSYFLKANALIQKAASDSSEANKTNEIYQQALGKVRGVLVEEGADAVTNELFALLEKDLESEPKLQKEIQAIMNEINMKTTYDINMLHIDFSFV